MYGKLDSTYKHSVFEPLWKKNFGGMTWSKLWGGWHQIIGGDISPPSPPGFAPLIISKIDGVTVHSCECVKIREFNSRAEIRLLLELRYVHLHKSKASIGWKTLILISN